MCMKKYLDGYKTTWKVSLDNYLSVCGGSFLLKCNYDVKLNIPSKDTPGVLQRLHQRMGQLIKIGKLRHKPITGTQRFVSAKEIT